MDNQRLLIWAFFGLMAWMTYQAWLRDNAPPPPAAVIEQLSQPAIPQGEQELPEMSTGSAGTIDAPAPVEQTAPEEATAVSSVPTIRVTTEVLDIETFRQCRQADVGGKSRYPLAALP